MKCALCDYELGDVKSSTPGHVVVKALCQPCVATVKTKGQFYSIPNLEHGFVSTIKDRRAPQQGTPDCGSLSENFQRQWGGTPFPHSKRGTTD